MIDFLTVPELKPEDITPVDCPTCPVSMSCIVGAGGNGWRFDCCGLTGFVVEDGVAAIDCAVNRFEQSPKAKLYQWCPVCSGNIMEVVERARRESTPSRSRWLPTVHAKVPLAQRLARLKTAHREAIVRLDIEKG